MGYLIAALAAPIAGPALYRLLHDRPTAVRFVDGFVYLAVPLLVVWQVVPHALEERSVTTVVALGLGFLLPAAMERASHALEQHTDNMALLVGLSGLVIHALLEGAGLAPRAGAVAAPFALAVILHRIPVSLVIWWLIRPRFGWRAAVAGVGSIVMATLVGYGAGVEFLGGAQGPGLELYQAFVSGSLVHVVFHQGRHDHQHDDDEHPTGHSQKHAR
ncbi:MAG: hypothetical protein IIC35_04475 [Gemmatimonadetes bacterium]|nr:hypothetical protein [Gemmatimonadota bacterium]